MTPAPTPAVEIVLEEPVRIEGGRFAVAVRFIVPEAWHIYWGENPGQTGMATRASLAIDGRDAGLPSWSAPKRRVDLGDITSFVYEPEGWAVWEVDGGSQMTAVASWLLCRDMCVNGTTTLTRTMSGSDGGRDPRARLPIPAPATTLPNGMVTVCLPQPAEMFPNVPLEETLPTVNIAGRSASSRWSFDADDVRPGMAAVFVSPDGDPRGWRVRLSEVAKSETACSFDGGGR